jgi:hypothetical protein
MKRLIIALLALVLFLTIYAFQTVSGGKIYAFMKTNHPVDMIRNKQERWIYYSLSGDPADVVKDARKELTAHGFIEDDKDKPWFRFTKANETIIVCNHDDIETVGDRNGEHLAHSTMPPSHIKQKWAVVWERQQTGSAMSYAMFKVKRTILGW